MTYNVLSGTLSLYTTTAVAETLSHIGSFRLMLGS